MPLGQSWSFLLRYYLPAAFVNLGFNDVALVFLFCFLCAANLKLAVRYCCAPKVHFVFDETPPPAISFSLKI